MTPRKSYLPYIIIGAFALFMAFILQFVFRSMKNDVQLVSPNYYQKEIEYQTHIDKIVRSSSIKAHTQFDLQKGQLVISIPKSVPSAKGTIYLYNGFEANLDIEIPFEYTTNTPLIISTSSLKEGVWTVKIDFESEGKEYYIERKIIIE